MVRPRLSQRARLNAAVGFDADRALRQASTADHSIIELPVRVICARLAP